ncbi:hypothetical protein DYB28_003636, partial [Aphanomyces astaci]
MGRIESLQSPRMRKKILAIPSCIRSLLDTVPKVHKMLAKHSLGHTILTLYALCSYLPDEGFATMLDFLGDVLELDPTVPSLQSVLVEYDLNEHDRDHASSVDLDWVLSYVVFQWSNAELELDATVRRAFREVLMATSGTHQSNLLLQMDGFVSAVQQVWPDCVDHDMQHLYMDMMATKRENFRLASERRRKEKLR